MSAQALCGLVLIDKPEGPTSHHVVARVRKLTGVQQTGHLGTLDPFASGLLPVMIGGATRLSENILEGDKQYLFGLKLGVETDTLDGTGRVVQEAPVPQGALDLLHRALPQFLGAVEQVPPVYSALKIQGQPMYAYIRATGSLPVDIETRKRVVHIHSLEIVDADPALGFFKIRVRCGKGTYVRSLARDLSKAIGTVGHCQTLRREGVAPWNVSSALSWADLQDKETAVQAMLQVLIPPHQMIHAPEPLMVGEAWEKPLQAGNVFTAQVGAFGEDPSLWVGRTEVFLKGQACGFYCEVETLPEGWVRIRPRKKMW